MPLSMPLFSSIAWTLVMASPPPTSAPLERGMPRPAPAPDSAAVHDDGEAPLAEDAPPAAPAEAAATMPPDGVEPLADWAPSAKDDHPTPVTIAQPFGNTTKLAVPQPDPRTTRIARIDFLAGPMFRVREVDPYVQTGFELGAMHGLSGSFHLGMLVASQSDDRDFFRSDALRAWEFPIGGGVVLRGKLPKRPLFGSIGLSAGMLVHRAKFEEPDRNQVVRRVDPDFRLPIRFSWTIATVGVTLALEQGYSVRSRSYSRQGAEVWSRSAYRIGFVLGLHSDVRAGRTALGRSKRRSRSRS